MIPITLLPQAISHGGREAGSIFYATEMVELADEIWGDTDKGGGGGAGQSNDSVTIADRSLGQREEAWRPRALLYSLVAGTTERHWLLLHVIHVSWKTESSPDAQKRRVCRVLRKIYSWRRRKHFTSVCFLVEKVVETREREKVIQILAAGNNIQNIQQITGRFVSNLYKQRLLVGA
ncbi:hypothetical protein DY000_02055890 [Brassica cretica]|uniref:Uncharacterized protein n=1 Tax=Brassica cretica TaxID=69181 RepID=A0ABQ7AKC7_BRACR|nr:hypothetical protein DY000_02055890 [Brassica cretica]